MKTRMAERLITKSACISKMTRHFNVWVGRMRMIEAVLLQVELYR